MLRNFFLYLSQNKKAQQRLLQFRTTRSLAARFVAGDTLADGLRAARKLNAAQRLGTLDHLGEHVGSAAEAEAARAAYLAMLAEIQKQAIRSTISIKLTQLGLDVSEAECRRHLRSVVEYAQQSGNFVRVDMEGSAYTERTLAMIREMFREMHPIRPKVGAVIQAYLYRSKKDIPELIKEGISVRLCKGAYKEPASIAFPHKADVDRNYVKLMQMLLSSGIYHAIATHDPRMIAATREYAAQHGLGKDQFEFQMLYGIRTDLQDQLVREGYRLRIYIPFGSEWFSYFMRRLAERPANVLFVLRNLMR